jgi:hypothetical protein
VADVTREDRLPARIEWIWVYSLMVHVGVLAIWSWAWGYFWVDWLRRKGGLLVLWSPPLGAAILAEWVQRFIAGHTADAVGLAYNLSGAALGLLLGRRAWRRAEAGARKGDPGMGCEM